MNRDQAQWAVEAIVEESEGSDSAVGKTYSLITLYHALDREMKNEEERVDIRHLILYNLLKMKKKTPTFMRLRMATWLTEPHVWKEEKNRVKEIA